MELSNKKNSNEIDGQIIDVDGDTLTFLDNIDYQALIAFLKLYFEINTSFSSTELITALSISTSQEQSKSEKNQRDYTLLTAISQVVLSNFMPHIHRN